MILEYAALMVFVCIIVGLYLRQRLFKCPDCYRRSDYDHIADVTAEAPYCPYCGGHTINVGRKYHAWLDRIGLESEFTRRDPEGERT